MPVILNPLTGKFDFTGATAGPTGGTGSAFNFDYIFSTDTDDSDPGAGFGKVNVLGGLATEAYISNIDANGVDRSAILGFLSAGDFLNVIDQDDITNDILFKVTANAIQNVDYLTIAVEVLSANGTFLDLANIDIAILFGGRGGTTGIQSIDNDALGIDMPDLSFNSLTTLSVVVSISMNRLTDGEVRTGIHTLAVIWDGINWVGGLTNEVEFEQTRMGVVFTINSIGNDLTITYTSDLMAGIYSVDDSNFSYVIAAVEI